MIYKRRPPSPGLEGPLADPIEALRKESRALIEAKATNNDQVDILKQVASSLKAETTEAKELGEFMDVFALRRREVFKGNSEMDEKIKVIEKKAKELRAQAHVDEELKKRGTQITVVVLAEADGPANLLLSYGESSSSVVIQVETYS